MSHIASARTELKSQCDTIDKNAQEMLKLAKAVCTVLANRDKLSGLENLDGKSRIILNEIQSDIIFRQEMIFQTSGTFIGHIDNCIALLNEMLAQSWWKSDTLLELQTLRNGYLFFKTELSLAVSGLNDSSRGTKLVDVLERPYETQHAIQNFLFLSKISG